jgi:tRNA threonylcarbamoyladenosine modification (KEOPS) complex  Pcc1 subunit
MHRGEEILLKIRAADLGELYSRQPSTIRRWIKEGKIDVSSLESVLKDYLRIIGLIK